MGVSTTMIPVLQLLLFAVVSPVSIQDKATPHWEDVCDTSLLLSEDLKSWDDARGTCELFGGKLVDIRSLEMNYCILTHAQRKGHPAAWYWHSGNDINVEGVWRYNNPGDLILWTPIWWFSKGTIGTPDGGRSQNCLLVNLSNNADAGKWSDYTCHTPQHYVCQRKL